MQHAAAQHSCEGACVEWMLPLSLGSHGSEGVTEAGKAAHWSSALESQEEVGPNDGMATLDEVGVQHHTVNR